MHRHSRFLRRLLALVVVPIALVAVSCGGDDEPADETPTSTTAGDAADDTSTTAGVDQSVSEAWRVTATAHRDEVGEEVDVECPAPGVIYVLWGSDVYTADSSICTAAVHVGLITLEEGGEVTILIEEGRDEYFGSQSNGVESQDFGPYETSFSFPDADPLDVAEEIGWDRGANFYRDRDTDRFTVVCEAGGETRNVWGTEVYTEDSSICTAAVHAGLIEVEEGGEVTFELSEGRDAYRGSEANGIASLDYGSYGGSFSFVEG